MIFLRHVLFLIIVFFTIVPEANFGGEITSREKEQIECRGVWLGSDTFNTFPKIDDLIKKIDTGNLNTVFLYAPSIKNNAGAGNKEVFKIFVNKCKNKGWSVHAWICNHHRKEKVDWTDPREHIAQCDWAMDVLDYCSTLDGIHFDYIRSREWGDPDESQIKGIMQTIKMTHNVLNKKYPGKFLTAAVFTTATHNYIGFRKGDKIQWQGDTPTWYRKWFMANPDNWYTGIPAIRPDLDPNGVFGPIHFHFQQDPVTWIKTDALDVIMPMQYTFDAQVWNDEADLWKVFLGDKITNRVYMGLGWWVDTIGKSQEEVKDKYEEYDASALIKQIKYGRSKGYKGFVIFTLGVVSQKDWDFINALSRNSKHNNYDAPFKVPAVSPLLSKQPKYQTR